MRRIEPLRLRHPSRHLRRCKALYRLPFRVRIAFKRYSWIHWSSNARISLGDRISRRVILRSGGLLYVFYLLIASLKYWVKARLIPFYAAAAFVLLSWEITLSWTNVLRFFTYEILLGPCVRKGCQQAVTACRLLGSLYGNGCEKSSQERGGRAFGTR